jgi:hypothetical protein
MKPYSRFSGPTTAPQKPNAGRPAHPSTAPLPPSASSTSPSPSANDPPTTNLGRQKRIRPDNRTTASKLHCNSCKANRLGFSFVVQKTYG